MDLVMMEQDVGEVSRALRAIYEAEVASTGRQSGVIHATPEQWAMLCGPCQISGYVGYVPVGISIETAHGRVSVSPYPALSDRH